MTTPNCNTCRHLRYFESPTWTAEDRRRLEWLTEMEVKHGGMRAADAEEFKEWCLQVIAPRPYVLVIDKGLWVAASAFHFALARERERNSGGCSATSESGMPTSPTWPTVAFWLQPQPEPDAYDVVWPWD